MERSFKRPRHEVQFKYDFHILEFSDEGVEVSDDGTSEAPPRLRVVEERVRALRREYRDGVVVIVFIHGWHHSAEPADKHLNEFQRILEGITIREWEGGSDHAVRPVVGVYIGWNGDPIGRWSVIKRLWGIKHLSFWQRYRTAKALGGSARVRKALLKIISAAKAPLRDGQRTAESPLVLAAHSMGSVILQCAFETLLQKNCNELLFRDLDPDPIGPPDVCTFSNGSRVFFPDLLLCLNSAADSGIARRILTLLNDLKIKRYAQTTPPPDSAIRIRYDAPLFVSITSLADRDTRCTWRLAQLVDAGLKAFLRRRTEGHDPALFTHTMARRNRPAGCPKRKGVPDFEQAWHCLHVPEPPEAARPVFPIDLPKGDRKQGLALEHEGWALEPKQDAKEIAEVAWIFQVPESISKCHNDIFRARPSALFMTMLQISGAVVGLAHHFAGNFEPPPAN